MLHAGVYVLFVFFLRVCFAFLIYICVIAIDGYLFRCATQQHISHIKKNVKK